MVLSATEEPMLRSAMRMVMKREKRMLLIGTGVPISATYKRCSCKLSYSVLIFNLPF